MLKKQLKNFLLQKTNFIAVFSIPFYLFRIFKIDNNKIVVTNYSGKGYGDNCKYIVEELYKWNKDCKVYWVVNNKKVISSLPTYIKPLKKLSIKYYFHMSTAKIWINNSRFSSYVKKRKNQYYIQTWHSSLRLKKIELDIKEKLPNSYLKDIKNDSNMINVLISGSKMSSDIYRRAFDYKGEILESGTPRCDIFFYDDKKEQIKKKIYQKFNIDNDIKTILYAPTFRNNIDDNSWMLDIDSFTSKISQNYQLYIRLHPNTKKELKLKNDIDLSSYPDMQELLIAVDFLITDYSGCCFDMMVLNKPCILFVKDLDLYLKNDRSLYFDFESLPFPIAKSEKDLVDIINNFDFEKYLDNINKFKNEIGLLEDGMASKRIVERICNIMIK